MTSSELFYIGTRLSTPQECLWNQLPDSKKREIEEAVERMKEIGVQIISVYDFLQ